MKKKIQKLLGLKNMNNEPVAIVELGGEVTWLTDVLPYKAKLYTHPPAQQCTIDVKVKELTDEEIMQVWWDANDITDDDTVIDFARAILRKAQEQ